MKNPCLIRILTIVTGGLLALDFPPQIRADADDKPAAKADPQAAGDKPAGDAPAEAPVKRNANGEMVVTVDAATQKRIQLEFARPAMAEWQPTVTGYGRVVDPAPLTAAMADLATAQLNGEASARELARLKTLAAENNASARALETAQLAVEHDRLALAAARAKLVSDWGPAFGGRADLPELAQQLAERKQSLVRLVLSAGDHLAEPPAATSLTVFPDDTHLIPAELAESGLGVDPQTEGQIFLFLVNDRALPLGAAVTGRLNRAGPAVSGVVVPAAAVLRHEGRGWVYLQTAEDEFTRHEIPLDRLRETGWFVAGDLAATNVVVTAGAQTVLSAEMGGGFSTGMRD